MLFSVVLVSVTVVDDVGTGATRLGRLLSCMDCIDSSAEHATPLFVLLMILRIEDNACVACPKPPFRLHKRVNQQVVEEHFSDSRRVGYNCIRSFKRFAIVPSSVNKFSLLSSLSELTCSLTMCRRNCLFNFSSLFTIFATLEGLELMTLMKL